MMSYHRALAARYGLASLPRSASPCPPCSSITSASTSRRACPATRRCCGSCATTCRLTGTKYGCGMSLCGACTVYHRRQADPLVLDAAVVDQAGRRDHDDRGLEDEGSRRPCRPRGRSSTSPQCGYCQSGQVMAATALLAKNKRPTDADIDQAMAGNVCRCATYVRIRAAIKEASKALAYSETTHEPDPHRSNVSRRDLPQGRRRAVAPASRSASTCPCIRADRPVRARPPALPPPRLGRRTRSCASARTTRSPSSVKHLEMGQGSLHRPCRRSSPRSSMPRGAGARGRRAGRRDALQQHCCGDRCKARAGRRRSRTRGTRYRQAGAAARAMLVAAAAQRWKVPAVVDHREGRRGARTPRRSGRRRSASSPNAAAALPVPADVKPRTRRTCVYIGKHVPRKDARAKITGAATLHAGREAAGHAHGGRRACAALRRRSHTGFDADALKTHSRRPLGRRDPDRRRGARHELLVGEARARRAEDRVGRQPRLQGVERGDHGAVPQACRAARRASRATTATPPRRSAERPRTLEAAYEFPYLAHAAMEPMNCVMRLASDNSVEVWNGEQFQTGRPDGDREDARHQARAGEDQHAVRGRQLRPAREPARPTTWSSARRSWSRSRARTSATSRSSSCGRARTT